jgi:hypothetical protein
VTEPSDEIVFTSLNGAETVGDTLDEAAPVKLLGNLN